MFSEFLIKQLPEKISDILKSAGHILPEMLLAMLFIGLIVTDLLLKKNKKQVYSGLFVIIALIAWFQLQDVSLIAGDLQTGLFGRTLISDHLSVIFRKLLLTSGILTVFLYWYSAFAKKQPELTGEFFVLLSGMLLGLHFMTISVNLMMIYLAIEVVSISSYILTAFRFGKQGAEAGMKYVLFGALSSGIMLYGMSFLYGLTGTLNFTETSFITSLQEADGMMALMACLLVLGGFLFKITAVPFHIWSPDVYEVAPTPVVAFFSVAPKIAGLAVLWRFTESLQGFHFKINELHIHISSIIAVLAIISILAGNLSALWQTKAKRMLAYSSIAHAGFLMILLVVLDKFALQSLAFYLFTYLLMNFLAFGLVEQIERRTESQEIEDYKGFGQKYWFTGVAFLIVMISLTGLPPTAGFSAKLFVFSALWKAYSLNNDSTLFWLFVIGLFNTAIALFYYLKIPYWMFIKEGQVKAGFHISFMEKTLVAMLSIALLGLFFKADWVLNWFN